MLAPKPIVPGVGQKVTVTVTIGDLAGANGLLVILAVSDTRIATAPAFVTIPGGKNSVQFDITGVAVGNTSITATAANHASDTAAISTRQNAVVLPPSVLVAPGSQVQFPIILSDPAPIGGLNVTLTTVNSTIGTVTSPVFIESGSSTGTGTASGVLKGTTTINASAPNFNTTSTVLAVKSIVITFNPAGNFSVPSTASVNRKVHLSDAAPVGGLPVTVQAADPTIASTTPASVTVAEGQLDSPSFAVVGGSRPNTNTTLTASATGATPGSVTVFVGAAPAINGLGAGTLAVGLQRSFTVSLNFAAPDSPPGSGGLLVSLSSSNPQQASLPAQVIVPTGTTSAAFTAAGIAVTKPPTGADQPVTITATAPGFVGQTAQISVAPAAVQIFDLQTARTTSSAPQTIRAFVVNTSCPLCFGDVLTNPLTVAFAAIDPNNGGASNIVTVSPTQVTIPALGNNTGAAQTVTLSTPTDVGQYAITASATGLPTVSSSTVTVTAPAITSVNGNTLAVGLQQSFSISLDSPAPDSPPGTGGMVVTLTSSNVDQVTVPSQVIVPKGASSVAFTVAGIGVTKLPTGADQPVTITASNGTSQKTKTVSVVPTALQVFDVTTPRSTFSRPQTIRAFVVNTSCPLCFGDVLTNPLPVTFAAIDPNTGGQSTIVTVSPTQVTIPALNNNTGSAQTVTLSTPTDVGQYAITASATGLPPGTSTTVDVTKPSVISIGGNTLAVGMQQTLSVALDAPAPTQGVVMNLASSDTSLVSVPPSVTIPGGQQSANFVATGVALPAGVTSQTVEISASAQGVTGLKKQISIVNAALSLFDLQTPRTTFSRPQTIRAFVVNSSCQLCFTDVLTNPLTVTFSAIDPSTGGPSNIVTVSPAQVTIPALANNTGSAQTVTLSTPSATGSYAIVLSAPGFPSVTSSTVTVTQPHISPPNSGQTLPVGALMHRDFLSVQLDSPAPQGGLTVSLSSSDTSKFTVPATVTVLAGNTSATFTLTGVGSTHDGQGVDHPATLTLTGPQPWIGSSASVSVTTPGFMVNGLQTSRTTQSAANQISITVLNPACSCGDSLNSPITVALSIQSTTTGIAAVTPTTVSLAANTAGTPIASISPPTTTGTYTVIVSASGFTTFVSTAVTVQ